MNGKLTLMCGIPGSGKSTYAKKYMKESNSYYISRDNIRFEMIKDEESYFSHENEVFDTFVSLTNKFLKEGKNVIADATFINKASRKKFLTKVIQPSSLDIIVLNTPLNVCLERNAARTGRELVPEKAIKNMYYNCETPTKEEGFDKITEVKYE